MMRLCRYIGKYVYMKYMCACHFFLHQMQAKSPYLQTVARVNDTEEVATGQQKKKKQEKRNNNQVYCTPSHDAGCRCFRRLNAAAKEAYPRPICSQQKTPGGRVDPPVRCSQKVWGNSIHFGAGRRENGSRPTRGCQRL